MDQKVQKLGMKIGDPALAKVLVKAGFDNPAKVRLATDGQLRDIPGVGAATLAKLRKRLPKRKG